MANSGNRNETPSESIISRRTMSFRTSHTRHFTSG